jgi:hypothetical protein
MFSKIHNLDFSELVVYKMVQEDWLHSKFSKIINMISQFFFFQKYSRGFKNAECNLVDFKVVGMVFKNASKNVMPCKRLLKAFCFLHLFFKVFYLKAFFNIILMIWS